MQYPYPSSFPVGVVFVWVGCRQEVLVGTEQSHAIALRISTFVGTES